MFVARILMPRSQSRDVQPSCVAASGHSSQSRHQWLPSNPRMNIQKQANKFLTHREAPPAPSSRTRSPPSPSQLSTSMPNASKPGTPLTSQSTSPAFSTLSYLLAMASRSHSAPPTSSSLPTSKAPSPRPTSSSFASPHPPRSLALAAAVPRIWYI